jgi:hypothetical protein
MPRLILVTFGRIMRTLRVSEALCRAVPRCAASWSYVTETGVPPLKWLVKFCTRRFGGTSWMSLSQP